MNAGTRPEGHSRASRRGRRRGGARHDRRRASRRRDDRTRRAARPLRRRAARACHRRRAARRRRRPQLRLCQRRGLRRGATGESWTRRCAPATPRGSAGSVSASPTRRPGGTLPVWRGASPSCCARKNPLPYSRTPMKAATPTTTPLLRRPRRVSARRPPAGDYRDAVLSPPRRPPRYRRVSSGLSPVIPAQAGIHFSTSRAADRWVPAFAGTTR